MEKPAKIVTSTILSSAVLASKLTEMGFESTICRKTGRVTLEELCKACREECRKC